MSCSDQSRSFWGWGDSHRLPNPNFLSQSLSMLKLAMGSFLPSENDRHFNTHGNVPDVVRHIPMLSPPLLQSIHLPPSRFPLPSSLALFCVNTTYDRLCHTYGKSYRDIIRGLMGDFSNPPDYVAYPSNENQILSLLKTAKEMNIVIIPFGGGSSVAGGVEAPSSSQLQSGGYIGVITVDLSVHFNSILCVNRDDMTVCVQGGMMGPAFENALSQHGLTLQHYPQSFEYSSVGGWVVTRGAGHFSTQPTHIDEHVQSIRMVTVDQGIMSTPTFPQHGAGPNDVRHLCGSEGTLGIVTQVTLRIHEKPNKKLTRVVLFNNFIDGCFAVRSLLHGSREKCHTSTLPAICRLIDPLEALYMGLLPPDLLDWNVVANFLKHKNSASLSSLPAVLVLGYEGANADDVIQKMTQTLHLLTPLGGVSKVTTSNDTTNSTNDGDDFKRNFTDAPYLRDWLVRAGYVVETLETCCRWSCLTDLHGSVVKAATDTMAAWDTTHGHPTGSSQILVTCRITHFYSDGPAPYFSFVIRPATRVVTCDLWDRVKAAVSDALNSNGGTITHHHSVGRDHMPWYCRERSPVFASLLSASKSAVDHRYIMNPGVLVTFEECCRGRERDKDKAVSMQRFSKL